jgi:dipeptidyl aminopeptidase/acylaminoacyl peptidase
MNCPDRSLEGGIARTFSRDHRPLHSSRLVTMKYSLALSRAALAAIICFAAAAASAQGQKRMTFDDVIALKSVSDAQISPDGKWVAYVVSKADMVADASDPDLYLVSTNGGDPIRLTTSKKADASPRWSPDGKWIAFISAREERPQLYLISPIGGEAEPLTSSKSGIAQFQWSPDGKKIAYVAQRDLTADEEKKQKDKDDAVVIDQQFRFTQLSTIDVASKKVTVIVNGAMQANDPQWAPDGARIAFSASTTPKADDGNLSDIYVVSSDGGAVRKLVENPGPDASPRWSPDGKWIAFSTRQGNPTGVGQTQLAVVSSDGGTPRMVATGFLYQPGAATWSTDGATLYFTASVRTTSQLFSVASAGGTPKQLTNTHGVMSGASFSRDRLSVAYTFEDVQHPADVYVASAANIATPTKLTDQNPQLRSFALGKSEVVRWKSKDGMEIEGVLVYPVDYTPGKRVPMVANIHGGPAGSWEERFPGNWGSPSHVWAGRGWAIFTPNPRGSTGYGEKFLRANIKDWGGGDFRDIQTGIDMLIAKGIADSTKLAQSGWSYGGYMTAWTLTQTNRFKALMVGAGLTDMASMYGTNDIPRTIDGYFEAEPWNDPAQYTARSAMTFIKQAKTPTLIEHGQADQRVPIGQSQELYLGLKKNNVPVELVFFPREPHGLQEPRHQLDKMTREYEWFAKYVLGETNKTVP